MSCPYYWWNYHYACRKSGKDVNEDQYFKYCRDFDYGDCPIYKQQDLSDGMCYLTTACIKTKGLPDDCRELMILRTFRDTYLRSFDEGKADIQRYYLLAPTLVQTIDKHPDALQIYTHIYEDLILPCIELISEGHFSKAHALYKKTTLDLQKTYLPNL